MTSGKLLIAAVLLTALVALAAARATTPTAPACVGGASSVGPITWNADTQSFEGDLAPDTTGCTP